MPIECRQSITGGKGNRGMFFERAPNIVAAGLPTAQQDAGVSKALEHYLLQEKVEALISDAIMPASKQLPRPPLRKPIPLDKRNAGPFTETAELISPTPQTKFQIIVEDLKETSYKTYWKTPLGKAMDPVPMLPEGFDKEGTFGISTNSDERLYDVCFPKEPFPDKTVKYVGVQTDRKYCPPFNKNLRYGYRTYHDKRGRYVRCCLTDDVVKAGKTYVPLNSIQANLLSSAHATVGRGLAPNNNINEVPEGHSFGILKKPDSVLECLSSCELNKGLKSFRSCLGHLNTVRKVLSKLKAPTFFNKLYLQLRYFDTCKSGWLPKDTVYKQCVKLLVRFDAALIEPLLSMWQAFDGSNIEYKKFVHLIDYREPSPEIPKIPDYKPDCLDYRTTYTEMVKPGQAMDNRRRAGLPSGRYFDLNCPIIPERCTAADKICLPQETDMKACIFPSILSLCFLDHRDMYSKQEPETIRKVFEKVGEKFPDDKFNTVWSEAQRLHSQGWVCFETFRRALENYSKPIETNRTEK